MSPSTLAILSGSSFIVGARKIPSEEVDRAFGMPVGKLRGRAGIVSLAYAAENESEIDLGTKAAQQAMDAAHCRAQEVDWIIATSETYRSYPSFAAQLHSRLSLREDCGALDVGGACLGLLNALGCGQALLQSGRGSAILVVTADVHSCILVPGRVPGEFGGLFGDGASAFLLRSESSSAPAEGYRLGQFFFGCARQYAGAIRVSDVPSQGLQVVFDGEALSRAAITRLEKILIEIERRSGIRRSAVAAFATHQPNPRLVKLLAKQLRVSGELFPPIAESCGNLGSSTCGAALHEALKSQNEVARGYRKPIFLASLGPGLLFGGGWLIPGSAQS